jgi:hypothetical protein
MDKPVILMLGKLPPPYMGPSIATEIILKSELKNKFRLIHLDTKAYVHLNEFGKWSINKVFRNLKKYAELRKLIRENKPELVWIPISQTTRFHIYMDRRHDGKESGAAPQRQRIQAMV